MLVLLRRADKYAPFKKASLANEIMARGYRASDGPCCTAANFQIDINGTAASPWNDSARKVFVEDFLTIDSHTCRDCTKIKVMFRSHFRTLQSHYAKYGVEPDDDDVHPGAVRNTAGQSSNATNEGGPKPAPKRTPNSIWFKSRPKASKARPALGVDGMSSDEEEENAPFRRYRVYDVIWRSDAVTKMLRALDALHRRWRRKSSKRGAQPRMRYLVDEVAQKPTRAVRRLPRNAYTPTWYNELKSFEKDNLNARPTDFDFRVPEEIKTYGLYSCRTKCMLTMCIKCDPGLQSDQDGEPCISKSAHFMQ
ncbi:hypothetical protein C8T65DRAFT_597539 [Cerioporus squamosus]|nr:hypothetical protein C8T65DRAFT_597539 [Cerioporus squamosus]